MTNLESTISEIISDMGNDSIPKDLYLSLCVKTRLEKQTDSYNEDFDKLLKSLDCGDFSNDELTKSLRSLRSLSEIFIRTYDRLIEDYEKFQKYLEKFE